jgi:DNA polymerase III alpha subunit
VLARGSSGYAALAAAISRAHLLGGSKGRPVYDVDALDKSAGNWLILTGCRKGTVRAALEPRLGVIDLPAAERALRGLVDRFGAPTLSRRCRRTKLRSGGPRFVVTDRLASRSKVARLYVTDSRAAPHLPGELFQRVPIAHGPTMTKWIGKAALTMRSPWRNVLN